MLLISAHPFSTNPPTRDWWIGHRETWTPRHSLPRPSLRGSASYVVAKICTTKLAPNNHDPNKDPSIHHPVQILETMLQGTVQSRDELCALWGEPGPVPAGYSGAWSCAVGTAMPKQPKINLSRSRMQLLRLAPQCVCRWRCLRTGQPLRLHWSRACISGVGVGAAAGGTRYCASR